MRHQDSENAKDYTRWIRTVKRTAGLISTAESKFNCHRDEFVMCDGELRTECIAFEVPFQDRLRELCVAQSVQPNVHKGTASPILTTDTCSAGVQRGQWHCGIRTASLSPAQWLSSGQGDTRRRRQMENFGLFSDFWRSRRRKAASRCMSEENIAN